MKLKLAEDAKLAEQAEVVKITEDIERIEAWKTGVVDPL